MFFVQETVLTSQQMIGEKQLDISAPQSTTHLYQYHRLQVITGEETGQDPLEQEETFSFSRFIVPL